VFGSKRGDGGVFGGSGAADRDACGDEGGASHMMLVVSMAKAAQAKANSATPAAMTRTGPRAPRRGWR